MKPKVSFIVPVYNVERYIRTCLDSIVEQTLKDWECILVDDGSPDMSGIICDEYASRDQRFRVIHKNNGGVSAARNDGINAASGDWVYLVDSDDWLAPEAAEKLYQVGEATKADCVMSCCEYMVEGRVAKLCKTFPEPFIADSPETITTIQRCVLYQHYNRDYSPYVAAWNKFVRLELLNQYRLRFDPYLKGVFDDGLWSLAVLEHCKCLGYIDLVTYRYRIVEGSITRKFKKDAVDIAFRGYQRIEEFIYSTGKDQQFWNDYYAHVVVYTGAYLSSYYFNQHYPGGIKRGIEELRLHLSLDPIFTASHRVNLRTLKLKDRYLAVCERKGFIFGLWVYVMGKRVLSR